MVIPDTNAITTVDFITLAFSVIAIGLSLFTFFVTRPIEKKQLKLPALLEIFKLLSSREQRHSRGIIFDVYWYFYPEGLEQARKEGKDKKMICEEGTEIKHHIKDVTMAFEQAGVIVHNKLVEPKLFFDMYARMVVSTWKALEEDILKERERNEGVCKWFMQLYNDAIEYFKEKPPDIYRRPSMLDETEIKRMMQKKTA